MLSEPLLAVALYLQAFLLGSAVLMLFGHALWLKWYARWSAPRIRTARAALNRAVNAAETTPTDLAILTLLPLTLQIQVVGELTRSLAGEARNRLGQVAGQIGLVAHAERLCGSRFWWRRLRGSRLLTMLRAGDDVLPHLFHDPHPSVRTQAAEWAASCPREAVIDELLDMLTDPSRLCRFSVRDSLLRIGPAALDPLQQFLETHSGPAAEAALEVAAGRADARFLSCALVLTHDAYGPTRRQAAAVLTALGGPASIDRLIALLDDADAVVRAEAVKGLGKLGHWPAAPQIAPRLRDPAWIVRREAGLALRTLGGPGLIYLRRYLQDDDRFAADMARQILDLPLSQDAVAQGRA
jgi:hypothetical protein